MVNDRQFIMSDKPMNLKIRLAVVSSRNFHAILSICNILLVAFVKK